MKIDRLSLAVAALCLAGVVAVYGLLPETVPIHWDAAGQIDSWGPRWNLLALGALPLACVVLFRLLPLIDPRRESYERHAKTYGTIERLTVTVLAALVWVSAAAALGAGFDIGAIVRTLSGLLFVGLGNFMGRIKRNYFVGIKTPWALADDEVWRLTHRRGGLVFIAMGLVYIATLALPPGPALAIVFGAGTVGGIAYIYLYSYLCWRHLRGRGNAPASEEREP